MRIHSSKFGSLFLQVFNQSAAKKNENYFTKEALKLLFDGLMHFTSQQELTIIFGVIEFYCRYIILGDSLWVLFLKFFIFFIT